MNGRWKWICEVKRRRRGHCTGLLEGSNRKDSFKDCLRELNSEFDISFLLFLFVLTFQVTNAFHDDYIQFIILEELETPTAVRGMNGEYRMEW